MQDRMAECSHDDDNVMTVYSDMDSHEACYELLVVVAGWMDVYIVEE